MQRHEAPNIAVGIHLPSDIVRAPSAPPPTRPVSGECIDHSCRGRCGDVPHGSFYRWSGRGFLRDVAQNPPRRARGLLRPVPRRRGGGGREGTRHGSRDGRHRRAVLDTSDIRRAQALVNARRFAEALALLRPLTETASLTNFLARGRRSMRCDEPYSLKPLRQRAALVSTTPSASAKRSLGPCGPSQRRLGALATKLGELAG